MRAIEIKNWMFFLKHFCLVTIIFCAGCTNGSKGSGDSRAYSSGAQVHFCSTADLPDDKMRELQGKFEKHLLKHREFYLKTPNSFTVPVYFHVIKGATEKNDPEVPDAVMVEQLDILNRAFSGEMGGVNTPYRFSLAGINRVDNRAWLVIEPNSSAEREMKSRLRLGGPSTLNVYIVKSKDQKILGWSTLPILYSMIPELDGIVLNYRALPGGSQERYNLGNTLVHEVGHWFGLLHTFTGECDGPFGDLIIDTAREKQPGKGEFCPTGRDSCPQQPGLDPIHNHMTYTEDACRSEFTPGQLMFMRFNALIFRKIRS